MQCMKRFRMNGVKLKPFSGIMFFKFTHLCTKLARKPVVISIIQRTNLKKHRIKKCFKMQKFWKPLEKRDSRMFAVLASLVFFVLHRLPGADTRRRDSQEWAEYVGAQPSRLHLPRGGKRSQSAVEGDELVRFIFHWLIRISKIIKKLLYIGFINRKAQSFLWAVLNECVMRRRFIVHYSLKCLALPIVNTYNCFPIFQASRNRGLQISVTLVRQRMKASGPLTPLSVYCS